ncbi:peptidoglycan-binding protein [Flavobacterium tegetincola]|uniref:peptidoglycan-binding protein n=1 Tax=Flavobacterium tegetincola TaxID=150172 RepID=UPI00041E0375|nr:peptidoglycan-binding protein [Flavobacterium tegetincola]
MARQDVLNKAESQNGTLESPANSNKTAYGLWYQPSLNGQKWCAMFVSWVFHHAGHPLGHIQTKNGIHHCQSAHNYYKEKGKLTSNPQPGDIVIYDWEGNGYADHIGIFIKWTTAAQTAIEAWEGNTSTSNNSDGGGVMKRIRSRNLIKSFINPGVYSETAVTPVALALANGARGSQVTQIQKYLYDIGYTIEIDGYFGNQTETQLKDFQTKNAMDATGIADAVTIGALQEEANAVGVAKSKFISGSYLRRGNVGFMVTELQRALNAKDITLNVPITGSFDLGTLKAVKIFQTKNRLQVDGIVGPKTFEKLGII